MLIIRAKKTIHVPVDPERVLGNTIPILPGRLALVSEVFLLPEDSFEVMANIEIDGEAVKDSGKLIQSLESSVSADIAHINQVDAMIKTKASVKDISADQEVAIKKLRADKDLRVKRLESGRKRLALLGYKPRKETVVAKAPQASDADSTPKKAQAKKSTSRKKTKASRK